MICPPLIAQRPAERRGDARLLVLGDPGVTPSWVHAEARDLPRFLPPTALVVLNDSKVVPARVYLRGPGARRFELLVSAILVRASASAAASRPGFVVPAIYAPATA